MSRVPVSRYAAAVAIVALAIALRALMDEVWGTGLPFITLFPAVMLSAWIGGLGPGLLATAIGAAVADFVWLGPIPAAFAVPRNGDLAALVFFVVGGMLSSWIVDRLHRARAEASRARAQAIDTLESIADGFAAVDGAWRLMFVNARGAAAVGRSPEELRGRSLWDAFPELVESPLAERLRIVARDRVPAHFEGFAESLRRWFSLRIYPRTEGGLTIYAQDITDRKQVETERTALFVREQESRRLAQSLARVGRAVAQTVDSRVAVRGIAEEARSLLRAMVVCLYRLDERTNDLVIVEVAGDMGPGFSPDFAMPAGAGLAGQAVLQRRTITAPDILGVEGVVFPHDVRRRIELAPYRAAVVAPLIVRGRVLGVLGIGDAEGRVFSPEDLTVVEALADQIAVSFENVRLYHEAQRERSEAEAANRAKDEFLAMVSHELRTPLNAMLGWARMLQAGLDPDTARRAVDVIERNAEAQRQLIEDLLDISRITTGRLRLEVRPVQLVDVVNAALDAARPAGAAKDIRLEPLLDPRAGPIAGDPDRLQQVVWNLLSNALKFTPRRGRVQVRLEQIDSHVAVVVSDTGEGILPDVLPHVFEMFRQGDSGTTRRTGGLGLGLALVKHIVELHGGSVHADSAGPGQGATFRVELPLMIQKHVAGRGGMHPIADSRVAVTREPRLAGIRVLLLDDDHDSVELLGRVLVDHDAVVRTAGSVAEAFGVLESWRPDIIVSDIEMPHADGYAFIERLRAMPAELGGTIPAIAVTAYGRAQDRVRALTAGFESHIPKPVEPAELLAVVSSLARSMRH